MEYTYEALIKEHNWNLPKNCPSCGSPLIYTSSRVYCSNSKCKGSILHRINKWIKTLDVKYFGPALQKFVVEEYPITSISHLYSPCLQQSIEEKWGLNAVKAFKDLNSKRNISLAKLLAGFDIGGLGEELFQLLVDAGYNTVYSILNLKLEDIIKVKGWSNTRANIFLEGLKGLRCDILQTSGKVGIQIQDNEKINISSGIEGKHICVTGKLNNYSRKDIEVAIKAHGGIMDSSVTSKTDILCTNDQTSGSSKLKNAAKYETKIITENELIEMMKGN